MSKKYLLILSILLLYGYHCLPAHANQQNDRYATVDIIEHSDYSRSDCANKDQTVKLNYAARALKKDVRIISETNKKENFNFSPLRKYLELSNYFTSYYTCMKGYFLYFIKVLVPHSKTCFNSPSHTYILFQVIRI